MPPSAWFSTVIFFASKYCPKKYPQPHWPLLPLPSVPLRIVELPTRNITGFDPTRVEPGAGRADSAFAMESGVLSTTLLTSAIGSGRLSNSCARASVAEASMKTSVVKYRFIVFGYTCNYSAKIRKKRHIGAFFLQNIVSEF